MKKNQNLILLSALVLPLFTGCGGNKDYFEYTLLDDGTYSIRLNDNFRAERKVTINEETGQVYEELISNGKDASLLPRSLEIPSTYKDAPVTKIDEYGFCNPELNSITLPSTITEIGDYGFLCVNLEEITLPTSLKTIGEGAFLNSTIKNIVIPENVESIERYAFYKGFILESVTFNTKNVELGEFAFASNEKLKDVDFNEGIISIGDSAFRECRGIEEVTIPSSTTYIGENAFYECNSLKNVVIEEGLKVLENSSFHTRVLENIVIPKSIEKIEIFSVFINETLENVYYCGSKEDWNKITIEGWDYESHNASICYYYEEPTVFDYLEANETEDKIWNYDNNHKPQTISYEITNSVDNKSYMYSGTKVVVSNEYWEMLNEAKKQGMLEEVLDSETLIIYNNSIDAISFSTNLAINFENVYRGLEVRFSENKVTLYVENEQYSVPLEYIEVNNSDIYYTMSEKLAFKINDGKIVEDLSNEYIKVVHTYSPLV